MSRSPVAPNMPKIMQITIVRSGFTHIERKIVDNLPRVKLAQKMEVVCAPSVLLSSEKGTRLLMVSLITNTTPRYKENIFVVSFHRHIAK